MQYSIQLLNADPKRHHFVSPTCHSQDRGSPSLLLVFLVRTLVIAWRMMMPAFSISFFESPVVTHTLRAGCNFQPCSLAVECGATGMLFRRVMRTPLARVCEVS